MLGRSLVDASKPAKSAAMEQLRLSLLAASRLEMSAPAPQARRKAMAVGCGDMPTSRLLWIGATSPKLAVGRVLPLSESHFLTEKKSVTRLLSPRVLMVFHRGLSITS